MEEFANFMLLVSGVAYERRSDELYEEHAIRFNPLNPDYTLRDEGREYSAIAQACFQLYREGLSN